MTVNVVIMLVSMVAAALSSAAVACQTGAELPVEDFDQDFVTNGVNFFNVSYGNLSNSSIIYNAIDVLTTGASWTGNNATAPCVVFVHGGAWRSYSKNVPRFVKELRGHGITAVAIGYRLSWEANWPAQIDDVESAIKFLKLNAADYRIDPERIIAVGSSAGGHLVSMLGTRNPPESSARVLGVVDFYGPAIVPGGESTSQLLGCPEYSALPFVSHLIRGTPYDNTTECYDKQVDASPYAHVASDNPPFLILQGKLDTTVPWEGSVAFRDKLNMSGVDVRMILNENAGHDKEEVLNGTTLGIDNEEWFDRWVIQMFKTCGHLPSTATSLVARNRGDEAQGEAPADSNPNGGHLRR